MSALTAVTTINQAAQSPSSLIASSFSTLPVIAASIAALIIITYVIWLNRRYKGFRFLSKKKKS